MIEERGGNVLILEDDPGVARLERLRLERVGYSAVVASTPAEALRAIEAGGVDLMLLDFKLEAGPTGIDFHRQVRAAGYDVPSILVTGFSDEAMLAQALRAGLRDFLPKTPDYLDFLAPTVDRVMNQVRTERALEARQRMLVLERQRSGQLQRLAATSSRLNAALDIGSVLRLLAAEARALVGAGRAVASLAPDGDWSHAAHAASDGRDRDDSPPAPPPIGPDGPGDGAVVEVCRVNRPLRLRRGAGGDIEPPPGATSWLAAPLIGRRGRNIGLVQLVDKPEGSFTQDDEAMLVQLAQMASVAAENARLYKELRDNDRRKNEFLAMLAHELRNPLAAIEGAVRLSRQTGLEEHREWAAEVVQRQTRQLSRLIDDLLDISRINSGKIHLRRERLDLATVVTRAVDTIRPAVDARGHDLAVTIEGGPHHLDADPTRLEQVLVNLLANAAKYTPDRGRLGLSARREGDEVVVEVRDDGVGIAPEILPRVFDAFIQADQTLDRAGGGLGVGLTLVRRLLELHGGSITATSEGSGKGSTFTVRLPAAARPEPERPGSAPGPAGPPDAARRPRVLIVDDNVDTARAMARLLVVSGYEVRVAHDGREAIAVARAERPGVLLLDIGLPGMDGYEVAREVRKDPDLAASTLIAISGYGQEDDRRRSREAGFDHHLVKPVDYDLLHPLLESVTAPAQGA